MQPKDLQRYKEQAVNTMTQGELLLVLYSELVKRLTQAELALDKENYPIFEASLDRAASIVQYLDDTLDRNYEISANLSQLYEYFSYELIRAKLGRHKDKIAHVCAMVRELQTAFEQANSSTSTSEPKASAGE